MLVPLGDSLPMPITEVQHALRQIRLQPVALPEVVQTHQDRRAALLTQMWQEDNVILQLRQRLRMEHNRTYVYPDIQRQPTVDNPIFLYIFSGRRREGDFQQFAEQHLAQQQCSGRILLIDLALSTDHDVYDERLVSLIIAWMKNGVIAGVLVAPPCETWSEARFLEADTSSPRPLRSNEDPLES